MIWDLYKGFVIQTFNSSQKSLFHIAKWNSQILFVAYCKNNAIMFEVINMETNTHETRIEHILFNQETRSPFNYPTATWKTESEYKSKLLIQIHLLEIDFFFMSENSRYYSIPIKHHKSVKIMERETNECVAEVQLDFRIRDIIFSPDMNLFAATDG